MKFNILALLTLVSISTIVRPMGWSRPSEPDYPAFLLPTKKSAPQALHASLEAIFALFKDKLTETEQAQLRALLNAANTHIKSEIADGLSKLNATLKEMQETLEGIRTGNKSIRFPSWPTRRLC